MGDCEWREQRDDKNIQEANFFSSPFRSGLIIYYYYYQNLDKEDTMK